VTRQPLRVALYGEFGTENLGNEGSLQVTIDQLRSRLPGADLVAVCVHPETVIADHSVPAFAMTAPRLPEKRLPRVTRLVNRATKKLGDPVWLTYRLKGYDALVVAGTGIVEDSDALRAWQTPWSLLGAVVAARLRGAVVIFCGVGVSRPTTRLKRWIFGSALRLATYRSYRDGFSKDAATDMRVDTTRDDVYPDMCFALDRPPATFRNGPGPHRIGLGVMSYYGDDLAPEARIQAHNRYVFAMTACATHLAEHGNDVILLIGESNDTAVAEKVVEGVSARSPDAASRLTVHTASDLTALLREMACLDVVMATRFHNVVCALHVGLPSLAVVYAPKTRALMEAVGQGRWCTHPVVADHELLIDLLDKLVSERSRAHEEIVARTDGYPAAVHRQFDEIAALIAQRRSAPALRGSRR
jgi:polysaccharide pyruvyl transferase WcaK-like protein